MEIKKVKNSYNDYELRISWGQLNAIFQALEKDHVGPLEDELWAGLSWYIANALPGPGEDEEEYKQAKDAEKQTTEAGEGEVGPDQELLGDEVEEAPEEDEFGAVGGPKGAKSPAGPKKPEEPEERGSEEEADHLLERPPERVAAV